MHSQDPVTKEEWYNAQKFQSETIKTVENHLSELKGDIKEQLNRIETQTTQTNGSVKTLQIWKAGMKGWMNGFGVSLLVILGLVSYIFLSLKEDEQRTQNLLVQQMQNK